MASKRQVEVAFPTRLSGLVRVLVVFSFTVSVCLSMGIVGVKTAVAAQRSYKHSQVLVDLKVNSDASLEVTEQRKIKFIGQFHAVYWDLNKLLPGSKIKPLKAIASFENHKNTLSSAGVTTSSNSIGAVTISKDAKVLENCSYQAGWGVSSFPDKACYSYQEDANRLWVFAPFADETAEVTIQYAVDNAVQIYADTAELYWQVVGPNWKVDSSKVTFSLELPPGAEASETKNDRHVWLHGPLYAQWKWIDPLRLQAQVGNVRAGQLADIRVLFNRQALKLAKLENANVHSESVLNRIVDEEKQLYEKAEAERWWLRNTNYVIGGISLLLLLGVVGLRILKRKPRLPQIGKYWRESPNRNLHPLVISHILGQGKSNRNIHPALLVRLCSLGLAGLQAKSVSSSQNTEKSTRWFGNADKEVQQSKYELVIRKDWPGRLVSAYKKWAALRNLGEFEPNLAAINVNQTSLKAANSQLSEINSQVNTESNEKFGDDSIPGIEASTANLSNSRVYKVATDQEILEPQFLQGTADIKDEWDDVFGNSYHLTRQTLQASFDLDVAFVQAMFAAQASLAVDQLGNVYKAGMNEANADLRHAKAFSEVSPWSLYLQRAQGLISYYTIYDRNWARLCMAMAWFMYGLLAIGAGLSYWIANLLPLFWLLPVGVIARVLFSRGTRLTLSARMVEKRAEALRCWMRDYTDLNEDPVSDVQVWGELMVFAVLLGESKEFSESILLRSPKLPVDPAARDISGWFYAPVIFGNSHIGYTGHSTMAGSGVQDYGNNWANTAFSQLEVAFDESVGSFNDLFTSLVGGNTLGSGSSTGYSGSSGSGSFGTGLGGYSSSGGGGGFSGSGGGAV